MQGELRAAEEALASRQAAVEATEAAVQSREAELAAREECLGKVRGEGRQGQGSRGSV